MRILHLYKDYFPVLGGIENHIKYLAEGLRAQGHDTQVLVTNTERRSVRQTHNGVPVTKTGRWVNLASAPLSPFMPIEYLRRRFGKNRPDIVHMQAPYPPGEITWLLGNWGKNRPRSVISYQSDIVRQKKLLLFYAPILRLVLKRVDVILATSPQYIESSPYLRPHRAKCRVVPIGIEHERFANAPPADLPKDRKIILFTGRLRYYKGLQYLVEAMPTVSQDARLVIVGIGPMEAELRAAVARLNIGDRVEFAGEISDDDLPGYYRAADIFVLPSCERSEAYGIVQVEAMAAGLPVVSTELGTGTSYVNQHEQTGLVVPPADPPSLATALNRLLADDNLRQTMGQAGQARVRAAFTIEENCNQVEQIYRELLNEK
jgi:glycosyltransferase involved in cell wall biosynthesis